MSPLTRDRIIDPFAVGCPVALADRALMQALFRVIDLEIAGESGRIILDAEQEMKFAMDAERERWLGQIKQPSNQ